MRGMEGLKNNWSSARANLVAQTSDRSPPLGVVLERLPHYSLLDCKNDAVEIPITKSRELVQKGIIESVDLFMVSAYIQDPEM